jgi:hypothetical protein
MCLGATRGEACLFRVRHRSDGDGGGRQRNGSKASEARSTEASKW